MKRTTILNKCCGKLFLYPVKRMIENANNVILKYKAEHLGISQIETTTAIEVMAQFQSKNKAVNTALSPRTLLTRTRTARLYV
jgi:hypothetical protein